MNSSPDSSTVRRDWFGLAGFRPGPAVQQAGAVLYLLDEVGSTSDFLLGRGGPARGRRCSWDGWGWCVERSCQLAPIVSLQANTIISARHQTNGHGRQGRRWHDCRGLQMSFVITPGQAALVRGYSVWVGLQVALLLRKEFSLDARLKWPNDIVVGGRKCGGILLQRSGPPENGTVVVGVGLNLGTEPGSFPGDLQGRATSYRIETGRAVSPGAVGGALLARIAGKTGRFVTEGWQADRDSLALMDSLLGQRVQLDLAGEVYRGRAAGIDDDGGLMLVTEDGHSRSFCVGDVHLVPLPGADPGQIDHRES